MKWVDKLVDLFGSIPFIFVYNIITIAWIVLGISAPWFPDPYPSNFYTFLVSWLAINMSALILFSDLRRKKHEVSQETHQRKTLEAILKLAESMEHMLKERGGSDETN